MHGKWLVVLEAHLGQFPGLNSRLNHNLLADKAITGMAVGLFKIQGHAQIDSQERDENENEGLYTCSYHR